MNRYAVVGNPVEHSLSPAIHTMFAEQVGEDVIYEKLLLNDFVTGASAFFADPDAHGLNITLPFKAEALAFADRASERAQRAGAANLLRREADGRLYADNTDGVGLLRDLGRLGLELSGCSVLLVGAGGAARGIVGSLCEAGVGACYIGNRTASRARTLAADWQLRGGSLDELVAGWDLVINATSGGHDGRRFPVPAQCGRGAFGYDLSYGASAQPMRQWAAQAGCRGFSDGLGMLVEQAAESFLLWRGVRPQTAPVLEHLTEKLAVGRK